MEVEAVGVEDLKEDLKVKVKWSHQKKEKVEAEVVHLDLEAK